MLSRRPSAIFVASPPSHLLLRLHCIHPRLACLAHTCTRSQVGGRNSEWKARKFAETLIASQIASHGGGGGGRWSNVYRSVNDHQYVALGSTAEECNRLLQNANCMGLPPKLFECISSLNARHKISHGGCSTDPFDC